MRVFQVSEGLAVEVGWDNDAECPLLRIRQQDGSPSAVSVRADDLDALVSALLKAGAEVEKHRKRPKEPVPSVPLC